MKNFYLLLILVAAQLLPHQTLAYDFKLNGLCYEFNSDRTAVSVTREESIQYPSYRELKGAITIPPTVEYNGITYPVTTIESYAFYYCEDLTSVTIPNSVLNIKGYAFKFCI